MSAPIPGNHFSSGRNNYSGGPYHGAKPRSLPVPLMAQGTSYSRNSRFAPYTSTSGRFQAGFECHGPTQQATNRNQYENNRQSRLRTEMDRISYSEALKATTSCDNDSPEKHEAVTLQISNLDPTCEEHHVRNYLLSQLKPITPVVSLTMETPSIAKIKVPSNDFAKQVSFNFSCLSFYQIFLHNRLFHIYTAKNSDRNGSWFRI